MPSCVLAHPNPVMLRSLKNLLEPEFEVVGMADNPVSFVDAIRAHEPPLAVLALAIESAVETALARHVVDRNPRTRVVVIGSDEDSQAAEDLLEGGCSAYIALNRVSEDLVPALRACLTRQP